MSTFVFWLGTYCQQREVEAITEGVDDDDGMYAEWFLLISPSIALILYEVNLCLFTIKFVLDKSTSAFDLQLLDGFRVGWTWFSD